MYDFYVLTYLKFLIDKLPPKQNRDLDPEIEESVQKAIDTLLPALRKEMLKVVFYALCAEYRHWSVYKTQNMQKLEEEDQGRWKELMFYYEKYMSFHGRSKEDKDVLTKFHNVRAPSSDERTPETEKK